MPADQTPRPRVVHQWPPPGSGPTGTTPCCGMQPMDLPVADRMANNVGEVTCEALAARARAFAVVPTVSDSNSEGRGPDDPAAAVRDLWLDQERHRSRLAVAIAWPELAHALEGLALALLDDLLKTRTTVPHALAACPDWCDGPECDHPPRVGGACTPCAVAHYATHAAASGDTADTPPAPRHYRRDPDALDRAVQCDCPRGYTHDHANHDDSPAGRAADALSVLLNTAIPAPGVEWRGSLMRLLAEEAVRAAAGGAAPADRTGGLVDASAQPSPEDIEYDVEERPLGDYRTWRRYVAVPVPADDPPDGDEVLLVRLDGRKGGRVTIGHSRLPAATIVERLVAGTEHERITAGWPDVTPAVLRVLAQLVDDLGLRPPAATPSARTPSPDAVAFDAVARCFADGAEVAATRSSEFYMEIAHQVLMALRAAGAVVSNPDPTTTEDRHALDD